MSYSGGKRACVWVVIQLVMVNGWITQTC
jgi:hypothetical protein